MVCTTISNAYLPGDMMERVSWEMEDEQLRIQVGADGSLRVSDRRNGNEWATQGTPFVLHAWNRMMDRWVILPSSADTCTIEVEGSPSAATIRVYWREVQIGVEVVLRLLENGSLQGRIAPSGIREDNHAHLRLMSLEVWPDFGAVAAGSTGAMLLPFASGLLCPFDEKKTTTESIRRRMYMDQGEWESWTALPLFGLQQAPDAAMLCILEQGEWDAEVVAQLNGGEGRLHSVHAHWHFRERKIDAFDPLERIFRYVFLADREAGYAGMAKAYRAYLLTERGATLLADRAAVNPALAREIRAHSCKVFMGSKSRQADGKAPYDLFTTFDQAIEVLNAFREIGMEAVSYQFVGWNIDGHDGQYPTRFPVDPRVGGEAGLVRFQAAAKAAGHTVGIHDNYVDMSVCSPDWDLGLVAHDRDGEPIIGGIWSGGQTVYICGSRAMEMARREMPKVARLGLDGLYYIDAMPRVSRACHAADHGHHPGRRADGEGVIDLLRFAGEISGLPVGCENAMGFTIPWQDYAGHLPLNAKSLPAAFAGEWVPFFQIAVHGLIKYHLADPRSGGGPEQAVPQILREIEHGAMPRFEYQYQDARLDDPLQFHFGDWRPWLPVLATQHRILCQELVDLQTVLIDDHQRTADGISLTTYADGTVVRVDHVRQCYALNDQPWQPVRLATPEIHA